MSATDKHDALIEAPYPLQAHLGFEVAEWRDDFCRLELPLEPFLMNRHGIPHGGIYATLLDTSMGFAVCYTGDAARRQLVLTLSLNVNFLAVTKGEVLIAEGRRTGGGRKTAFAEGKVTDNSGQVIATGTGVFRYHGPQTGEKT
jgi:uncharacterized protein (TIGR00369 family)